MWKRSHLIGQVAVISLCRVPMNIVLISPYELGRQPFGLAEPAAWLKRAGFSVRCIDLSVDKLDRNLLSEAELIAIYVAMHTATRIAVQALAQIRQWAPRAHLCAYGLYAPVNEHLFRTLGVGTVLGGEVEPGLLALAERVQSADGDTQVEPLINLSKIAFVTPDRSGLPGLTHYAHLLLPDGESKTVGFTEASRGCKHLCRHCPVVPVYQGKFRIVPVDVVMADVRNQVQSGAKHISFGDPDFLNGPTHALRVVHALNTEFPDLTYDLVTKIEHIIKHSALLPELKQTGCLFITSAVESVDNHILELLDKNHTCEDFGDAVELLREFDIGFSPTFVAFTPWITLEGYVALLERLVVLELVEGVAPIQLAIRLLIPQGSYLLDLPGFRDLIDTFDADLLGYPWRHRDPHVDVLQAAAQDYIERAEESDLSRRQVFAGVWNMAHEALQAPVPELPSSLGYPIPRHSEPWYCCAEPTSLQLEIV